MFVSFEEKGDLDNNGSIFGRAGNTAGSIAKARSTFIPFKLNTSILNFRESITGCESTALLGPLYRSARERLARLKSSLNVSLVQHYKDSKGNTKVKGGPDLKRSAAYPIQLGLKAGGNCFSFSLFCNNAT